MLYSERKRLKELKDREDVGDNIWRLSIPKQLRLKLKRNFNRYGWVANSYDHNFGMKKLREGANYVFANGRGEPEQELTSLIDYCPDEDIPDIIESFAHAVEFYASDGVKEPEAVPVFHGSTNKLLESYWIGYTLENGEITEFSSKELHESLVVPALHLTNKKGWYEVEKSYQDALREVSGGDPSNAITDAATALQEALRKVGCTGGDIGALLKDAKKKLFIGYDAKYLTAVESLINWSSAARSNLGDGHKVTDADKDDAWFVIHVVGILILRLSKIKTAL